MLRIIFICTFVYIFKFAYRANVKNIFTKVSFLVVLFALTFTLLRYTVRFFIIPAIGIPEPASMDPTIHFTNTVLWFVEYFFLAAGYFYFTRSVEKEKELRHAVEQQLKAEQSLHLKEQERLQLENIALRAQINPHFLYNTLDFLYAKSLPLSDELSDSVMMLSDIMRYSLKPQDAEGMVRLADEAEHIRNIIEMNKLRFGNKLSIVFDADDIPSDVKIIPLVLITLVENVFKHGATNNPECPAIIKLTVTDKYELNFSTHNKERTGPKEQSTGIGLANTLKRLKNTYQDRCTTTVNHEGDYFTVALQIQLLKIENNYFA